MANVMELLRKIKTAIYGRDVRQSIYDAILQCYQDATGNPESIAAHTGDTNNPHNVTAEQVGLANAAEDISQAKKDISGLKNPEFEDFTAEGSTPPDARTAIAAITSKMSFFTYLSKVKAALMGLVTLGEMRSLLINNGLTTEAGKYFLDAAYGKTLSDLVASNASAITQLNSDQQKIIRPGANIGGGMCVYTTEATDKGLTRKFSYPNTGGSHDFGFFIIDQNRYVDIYAVAVSCGVKTILKTSSEAAPSLSGHILSVPLASWSSVVLITTEKNVTIN